MQFVFMVLLGNIGVRFLINILQLILILILVQILGSVNRCSNIILRQYERRVLHIDIDFFKNIEEFFVKFDFAPLTE